MCRAAAEPRGSVSLLPFSVSWFNTCHIQTFSSFQKDLVSADQALFWLHHQVIFVLLHNVCKFHQGPVHCPHMKSSCAWLRYPADHQQETGTFFTFRMCSCMNIFYCKSHITFHVYSACPQSQLVKYGSSVRSLRVTTHLASVLHLNGFMGMSGTRATWLG